LAKKIFGRFYEFLKNFGLAQKKIVNRIFPSILMTKHFFLR
jgi:hypothetical protein